MIDYIECVWIYKSIYFQSAAPSESLQGKAKRTQHSWKQPAMWGWPPRQVNDQRGPLKERLVKFGDFAQFNCLILYQFCRLEAKSFFYTDFQVIWNAGIPQPFVRISAHCCRTGLEGKLDGITFAPWMPPLMLFSYTNKSVDFPRKWCVSLRFGPLAWILAILSIVARGALATGEAIGWLDGYQMVCWVYVFILWLACCEFDAITCLYAISPY